MQLNQIKISNKEILNLKFKETIAILNRYITEADTNSKVRDTLYTPQLVKQKMQGILNNLEFDMKRLAEELDKTDK